MMQGNFYERLHFYMDSCAISSTASLFVISPVVAKGITSSSFCTLTFSPSHSGKACNVCGKNEDELGTKLQRCSAFYAVWHVVENVK